MSKETVKLSSEGIEPIVEAEETVEIDKLMITKTGSVDIIGLDVLRLEKFVETEEEAQELLLKYIKSSFDIINIKGVSYVIRINIADLNNINSLIPEDIVDPQTSIEITMKIGEILKDSGISVAEVETETDKVETETDKVETETDKVETETDKVETVETIEK